MEETSIEYQCKLCNYSCKQIVNIDSHKLTSEHLEKYSEMNSILKTDKTLYNKYITEFSINEEDNKTMIMLRQEIINKLSSSTKQKICIQNHVT